ncbi:MAG: SH3 domain-containing protein [Candidatus Nanopelagicales bacterium]|jgi:hypothetical protein|nr:SH3 domain-containing protein [Candidatus Nanopelagicales bacterium]
MHRTSPSTPTCPQRRPRRGLVLSAGVGLAAASALLAPSVMAGSAAEPLAAPAPPAEPLAATSSFAALPAAAASPVVAAATLSAADVEALASRGRDATSRSARSDERGPVPAALAVDAAGEELEPLEVEPEVIGKRYARDDVNVRTEPGMDSEVVTVLERGTKVRITDVTDGEWRQVVVRDELRWIKDDFLSTSKPKPRPAGPSSAACASSGVESGLTANAIAVHRAVCNAFPSITSYGGLRGGGGNHGSGRALDIMVSGGTGDAVAAFVRANAGALGVTEVIWAQRIWTTQRAGDGWRGMSDRGSATANHYDHVHVSVR